eukprot:m.78677 g.78677  ORF g.78677 m.78677 type:complete len:69 (+) comp14507_c0_seq15:2958-3164(+)
MFLVWECLFTVLHLSMVLQVLPDVSWYVTAARERLAMLEAKAASIEPATPTSPSQADGSFDTSHPIEA